MPTHEQKEISQEFAEAKSVEDQGKRDAWRGLLIPAVGSAAFLLLHWLTLSRLGANMGFPQPLLP